MSSLAAYEPQTYATAAFLCPVANRSKTRCVELSLLVENPSICRCWLFVGRMVLQHYALCKEDKFEIVADDAKVGFVGNGFLMRWAAPQKNRCRDLKTAEHGGLQRSNKRWYLRRQMIKFWRMTLKSQHQWLNVKGRVNSNRPRFIRLQAATAIARTWAI